MLSLALVEMGKHTGRIAAVLQMGWVRVYEGKGSVYWQDAGAKPGPRRAGQAHGRIATAVQQVSCSNLKDGVQHAVAVVMCTMYTGGCLSYVPFQACPAP